jgi:hypothetical protein
MPFRVATWYDNLMAGRGQLADQMLANKTTAPQYTNVLLHD